MSHFHRQRGPLIHLALTTLLTILFTAVSVGVVSAKLDEDVVMGCFPPDRVTDLTITRSGNDVLLAWSSTDADVYEVHTDENDFYFTPDFPTLWTEVEGETNYLFSNELGDPAVNSSFIIFSLRRCEPVDQISELSNRVGTFNFALSPGSS